MSIYNLQLEICCISQVLIYLRMRSWCFCGLMQRSCTINHLLQNPYDENNLFIELLLELSIISPVWTTYILSLKLIAELLHHPKNKHHKKFAWIWNFTSNSKWNTLFWNNVYSSSKEINANSNLIHVIIIFMHTCLVALQIFSIFTWSIFKLIGLTLNYFSVFQ